MIYQPFERGYMLWLSNIGEKNTPTVYALFDDQTFISTADTYDPDATPSTTLTPPTPEIITAAPGHTIPVGRLGKAWHEIPELQEQIGTATSRERSVNTTMLIFEHGLMLYYEPEETVFVFKPGAVGTWSLHQVD
jgi:hypothetical protein